MKSKLRIGILFFLVPILSLSLTMKTDASSFNQNNVIDDGVFNDVDTMSAAQIDNWLNAAFGSTSCISTQHGFSAPDPTGYNPTQGFLYGGNVSAGQVIYDAAQAYSINPEVLLSTLQKEQSLVSGGAGCSTLQYAAAAGYGCPDGGTTYSYSGVNLYTINGVTVTSVSGTCVNTSLKVGFSQQVIRAAWLLKFGEQRSEGNISWAVIKGNWNNSDDPQSCYGGPMTQGTFQRCPSGGSAYYDGYTTIDGTAVYMTNGATAAMYWYTPHFAGNQNFDTIFTSWFGPTVNPDLYFAVIQGPNSPALYLQTSAGKYYIPSSQLMQDWGINTLPVTQVSQAYLDNLPTHNWLGRLLEDDWGNLFLVDNGELHYIRNQSYLPLWGLNINDAVQSLGLAYSLPGSTWVGRFVQDESQPGSQIWLMDNGQKHAVADANMLYDWRYTPDQLTTVSTNYISSMPTGTPVTQYATDGTNNYLVDSGQKLGFANPDIQNAYYGSQTPVVYDPTTLSFLPSSNATPFVINPSSGQWFMLEGGQSHYITSGNLATLWGKPAGQPLTSVSAAFLASLPNGGNLAYVVQTASPSMYWLIDGTKHYISTSDITNAWSQPNTTIPTYSSQSLDLLSQGSNATTDINAVGSPYTYVMDSGTKHYLTTNNAKSAWGGTVMSVSPQLVSVIPEGPFVNYLVKNSSGQAYLLMNSTAYPISSNFYDAWGVTATTPVVTDQTLARYPISSTTLEAFIAIGNTSYVMTGGYKTPITRYADTYQSSTLGQATLPNDYFNTAAPASYLIKSTNSSDPSIWFMDQGKKMLLTFEQAVTYGYLSQGVQPTALSPGTLSLIPNDSASFSILIQKPSSGIKLLSFGYSLGFLDSTTLTNYVSSSNQILGVTPSVFDTFTLRRSTSRLIEDDYGNYYWMVNGQKDHILNWAVLMHYLGTPVTYLEGTTMALIPNGPQISQ